ncbi:hydrolase [Croceibacterium mercuriale]|uniref:Hydrolase n=1 Tax=Croceibacterium mercuriale TaxID=1572751 RepID=A0A0B2BTW8_9SPHN|nr:HAD family phosphatase [Croceibacterium mercuriale]KHL25003.1 hydrolase [Croceibacterium mercuriale]
MAAGKPRAVVFDIGRVLIEWDLRHLFAPLIDDPARLDWFLANVVTEDWHTQHDAGVTLADMVPARQAEYPDHAVLLDAYRDRFLETIPGDVPGSFALVQRLHERGVPLFALTNFGTEFFAQYRATQPLLDLFRDIVVSGDERCIKPDTAIYAIAERRFGLPAEALLFTDDKPENIAAAAARGWHTHLFTGAAGLEQRLLAEGLLD